MDGRENPLLYGPTIFMSTSLKGSSTTTTSPLHLTNVPGESTGKTNLTNVSDKSTGKTFNHRIHSTSALDDLMKELADKSFIY